MIDLDLDSISVPMCWPEIFGRQTLVDVEIGCGKGRFLNELAVLEPERDILAVERAGKYHKLCCERAARRGLSNVRLLRTTAEDLIFRLLQPSSVDRIFVLFPDPWPKKRHHKRRFLQSNNVAAMITALKPEGRLLVKSDHAAYAEVIEKILKQTQNVEHLDPTEAFMGLPTTGFELKYKAEGRPIYAFGLQKLAA